MNKILIVHEPKQTEIQEISELIMEEIKSQNYLVNFQLPSNAGSPAHHSGIIVCGPANPNLSENQSLGWIKKYGKILTQKSSAFFSFGSEYVESKNSKILIPRKKVIADTLSSLGWVPRMIDLFNEKTAQADIRRMADRFAEYVHSHAPSKAG